MPRARSGAVQLDADLLAQAASGTTPDASPVAERAPPERKNSDASPASQRPASTSGAPSPDEKPRASRLTKEDPLAKAGAPAATASADKEGKGEEAKEKKPEVVTELATTHLQEINAMVQTALKIGHTDLIARAMRERGAAQRRVVRVMAAEQAKREKERQAQAALARERARLDETKRKRMSFSASEQVREGGRGANRRRRTRHCCRCCC